MHAEASPFRRVESRVEQEDALDTTVASRAAADVIGATPAEVMEPDAPYVVGSMDEATLEGFYRTVVSLKARNENRSIQGIMRELGETGHDAEVRVLDALQTLARRGRLDLVPIVSEWSAVGGDDEVNETNETHWYEPVE